MAHVLNITDGTTTINLASSNKAHLDYLPHPPQSKTAKTVVESAVFTFGESSVANNIAAINALNRLLDTAELRRQSPAYPRVFITYQPDGSSVTYRSELYNPNYDEPIARLEIDPAFISIPLWTTQKKVRATLVFSRRPYYEHNTLTQIPLTNSNGSSDTSGLQVFNCNDGSGSAPNKRENYVQTAAADVLGEIPCPLYLELTHTFASNAARRFYIAHKAQGTPASFTHILEAEDASLNATYAASAADADCSGGNKVTVTNVAATAVTLATWTLSTTQAGYVISQWTKILARFEDLPSNSTCKVRFLLQDSVTTAQIGQSEWVTLSSADYLQQLGTLILSPNLQGQTTPGAMKLVMQGKDSAATCDFGLDFIQLSPSELGKGFRTLKPIDETLVSVPASTGVITDNAIDESLSIESRQNVYLPFGGPIMLAPNRINRLYFLHDGTNATAAITRTLTVKAYHRPRVLTL